MAQLLRDFAVLTKGLGSVPSIHTVAHNYLHITPVPVNLTHSSDLV